MGRTLRLILCGGDRCERHAFRVVPGADGPDVGFADDPTEEAQPDAKLDPPPGARRGWLDAALANHSFVVLVFYRGFW